MQIGKAMFPEHFWFRSSSRSPGLNCDPEIGSREGRDRMGNRRVGSEVVAFAV